MGWVGEPIPGDRLSAPAIDEAHELSNPCHDCGLATTPYDITDNPIEGSWEWYMVHNDLWGKAGGESMDLLRSGWYLCIGCLEQRLERPLTAADFPADCPVNHPHPFNTERLASRLAA